MKIICIGDSLTFGYGVWRMDCWVSLLEKRTELRVLNRGYNGDTTAYMLQRSKNKIIPYETSEGDIVIIMGGANDTLTYGANADDVKNILKICDLALEKNATPIIGIQPGFMESAYPFYGPLDSVKLNENFNAFAEALIAEAEARELTYLDLRPVLNTPELFEDCVHPTEEGHEIIADTVLSLIAPLIKHDTQKIDSMSHL